MEPTLLPTSALSGWGSLEITEIKINPLVKNDKKVQVQKSNKKITKITKFLEFTIWSIRNALGKRWIITIIRAIFKIFSTSLNVMIEGLGQLRYLRLLLHHSWGNISQNQQNSWQTQRAKKVLTQFSKNKEIILTAITTRVHLHFCLQLMNKVKEILQKYST